MLNIEELEEINREQLVTPLDRLLFRGDLMTRHERARRRDPVFVTVLPPAAAPEYVGYFRLTAVFTAACFTAMLVVMVALL